MRIGFLSTNPVRQETLPDFSDSPEDRPAACVPLLEQNLHAALAAQTGETIMQAITKISVLTTFAVLLTAAAGASAASACDRGGYIRSYSYYPAPVPAYGYGYGYRTFQNPVVPAAVIAPGIQPGPAFIPAPAIAPGPAVTPVLGATPADPAPIAPAIAPAPEAAAAIPSAVNPNQVSLQDQAPVAAIAAPASPN